MMTEISQLVLPSATHDSISCCFLVSLTPCCCPAVLPSPLAPRSYTVTTHLHWNSRPFKQNPRVLVTAAVVCAHVATMGAFDSSKAPAQGRVILVDHCAMRKSVFWFAISENLIA